MDWYVSPAVTRTKRVFGSSCVFTVVDGGQLVLPVNGCQVGGSHVAGFAGWATTPNSSVTASGVAPKERFASATPFALQYELSCVVEKT